MGTSRLAVYPDRTGSRGLTGEPLIRIGSKTKNSNPKGKNSKLFPTFEGKKNNTMNTDILHRLSSLRALMQEEHISAFIFPSTDPHQGEYIPDRWKGREWISGFNGSAGTVVVTTSEAALWTDSRYFLAAAEQLEGTSILLMKLKIPSTPTISEWLLQKLPAGATVGIDGMVNSFASASALISELAPGGISVRSDLDPLNVLWTDRPAIPSYPIAIHPLEYAGESVGSKLARIRQALSALHTDGMLVSALDDIAWTLNLRGKDVHCNPVFVSYLLIAANNATLYIDKVKVNSDVRAYLAKEHIAVAPYEEVAAGLQAYKGRSILLDPSQTCYSLAALPMEGVEKVYATSPIPEMKDVKNAVEISGFHAAMLRDGVALVRFLRWLKPAVATGGQTECSVAAKIDELRAAHPLYRGISFDTIAGYEAHGAIVHYEPTPETDVVLEPHGFLLVDTGAQYPDGTTDITRTIPLGPITEEQRHIYTLVLKGHIQLELCKFPDGASGTQLDALAREAMWREGLNYLHGTGHGVGSYLNVHEGPHQIRMEYIPTRMHAGMTVTDEPGIYLAGKFGVRIENTLLVTPYMQTEFGSFLQMESLTLCPIDTEPIDVSMLTQEELDWLNAYHEKVFCALSPFLTPEEQAWLKEKTRKIKKLKD